MDVENVNSGAEPILDCYRERMDGVPCHCCQSTGLVVTDYDIYPDERIVYLGVHCGSCGSDMVYQFKTQIDPPDFTRMGNI